MRQNGLGTLTLDDARTWIEETGLCLFLPKRQFSSSVAPSFVEAVAGLQATIPDPKHIGIAEELLVRLETEGVAVRLNLLGQPGEQPDFVVAGWVLPYVYALRGDRDWRRSPQLTGSRQVSQLAVLAYKLLEAGDSNISHLKQSLGREVTETAVLRAITELWQQLRIIPVLSAPGQPAKWQLLRTRFQRAIAEGASTSQVTAISVLASIYLQAVIAASMEEVELFLAPLTARSKIREVLRGLVATRQVHTISMGHAPHFYVAGTLPEFETAATLYASAAIPASGYFMRTTDRDSNASSLTVFSRPTVNIPMAPKEEHRPADTHAQRTPVRKAATNGTPLPSRPHFNRLTPQSRDHKTGQAASSPARPVRRGTDSRSTPVRKQNGSRSTIRSTAAGRWPQSRSNGVNRAMSEKGNGNHNGGSHTVKGKPDRTRSNSAPVRPSNGNGADRKAKPTTGDWSQRNVRTSTAKSTAKPSTPKRKSSVVRKDPRQDGRPLRANRKPGRTVTASTGSSKRFGVAAGARSKQVTKKRG
jgi:hypothetical protein